MRFKAIDVRGSIDPSWPPRLLARLPNLRVLDLARNEPATGDRDVFELLPSLDASRFELIRLPSPRRDEHRAIIQALGKTAPELVIDIARRYRAISAHERKRTLHNIGQPVRNTCSRYVRHHGCNEDERMPNAMASRSRFPRCHPLRSGVRLALVALLALLALLALAGCATHYEYTFHLTEPGAHPAASPGGPEMLEDADVKAEILVDGVAEAVLLDVTNKTDQVLQVEWAQISLARPDRTETTLRPDVDLGWLPPGEKLAARLFPLALPHAGGAALHNQGRHFQLNVPMIVRREAKVYHFTLTAHVRER